MTSVFPPAAAAMTWRLPFFFFFPVLETRQQKGRGIDPSSLATVLGGLGERREVVSDALGSNSTNMPGIGHLTTVKVSKCTLPAMEGCGREGWDGRGGVMAKIRAGNSLQAFSFTLWGASFWLTCAVIRVPEGTHCSLSNSHTLSLSLSHIHTHTHTHRRVGSEAKGGI